MLTQVLALHPRASRIHIGCDEPTLGANPLTQAAMERHAAIGVSADPPSMPLSNVIIEHIVRVHKIAQRCKKQQQQQQQQQQQLCISQGSAESTTARDQFDILMWHDALAQMPDACLSSLYRQLGDGCLHPVVWDYRPVLKVTKAQMPPPPPSLIQTVHSMAL